MSQQQITVKYVIKNVLENIQRTFNGFPGAFVQSLEVSQEPMRTGGRETGAHVVSCGKAKLLIEYSSEFSSLDLTDIRIVEDVSFDIPKLSRGRDVRYYLHGDMGRKNWEKFIGVVHSLEEGSGCCLLPEEWKQKLIGCF